MSMSCVLHGPVMQDREDHPAFAHDPRDGDVQGGGEGSKGRTRQRAANFQT